MLRVFVEQGETILISGPTGAGKSRLARWCHRRGKRRGRPFETLDLLSVPEDLQMAELLGWRRGAFTGATNNVEGALTRAQGGTLFLDEIDKLSLKAQAGLLRVLEERRYRPLGAETGEVRADVHFLVGTNVDLQAAVREGRFREDLYYRINVLPVRLPPLAERLDEVPHWAAFMLERASGGAAVLAPQVVEALRLYPWPGNLRQLDNVVRRAYAFAVASGFEGAGPLVEKHHVVQAMAFEGAGEESLTTRLWSIARELAREAVRRGEADDELFPLELMDGFRGMVLGAAVQYLSSRERAFRLFDREHLLTGRNHHRALKREVRRTDRLVQALGGGGFDSDLEALIEVARPLSEGRGGMRAGG
jgi:DNA-binding NtrC family response regulator